MRAWEKNFYLICYLTSKIVVSTSYQQSFLPSAFVSNGTKASAGETPRNKISLLRTLSKISITDEIPSVIFITDDKDLRSFVRRSAIVIITNYRWDTNGFFPLINGYFLVMDVGMTPIYYFLGGTFLYLAMCPFLFYESNVIS